MRKRHMQITPKKNRFISLSIIILIGIVSYYFYLTPGVHWSVFDKSFEQAMEDSDFKKYSRNTKNHAWTQSDIPFHIRFHPKLHEYYNSSCIISPTGFSNMIIEDVYKKNGASVICAIYYRSSHVCFVQIITKHKNSSLAKKVRHLIKNDFKNIRVKIINT
jgi:hypothetical protein